MPDFHLRPFRGEADFPAMVECANASFAADGMDIVRTVEDTARDYASFTSCVPATDVQIAQAAGEIAGYARVWHFAQADGQQLYAQLLLVPPHWRGRGVDGVLLAWIEARQREMAAGFPQAAGHQHHAFLQEGEAARAALLEQAGYRAIRYFFTMVRPTLDDIADLPLPPGVELRPVQPDQYRAIWDAHQLAFQDHWGYAPPSEEDYLRWLESPIFQPHLWQVAWDVRSNEVAGQVRTYIDAGANARLGRRRGSTEFITVGRQWRRQGLARALISHSLRAQKAAGMQDSELGVDGENVSGATRVYADCGFQVVKRNVVYRKPMAPARGA